MSTTLYEGLDFTLTRYCGKNGKVMYQITQRLDIGENQDFNIVQLSEGDLCRILHYIDEERIRKVKKYWLR